MQFILLSKIIIMNLLYLIYLLVKQPMIKLGE